MQSSSLKVKINRIIEEISISMFFDWTIMAYLIDDIVHISKDIAAFIIFVFYRSFSQMARSGWYIDCETFFAQVSKPAIFQSTITKAGWKLGDLGERSAIVVLSSHDVYGWIFFCGNILIGRDGGDGLVGQLAIDRVSKLFVVWVGKRLRVIHEAI